ncbi:MAG: CBS domain-containing protein [Halobacteriaceae archaeon]
MDEPTLRDLLSRDFVGVSESDALSETVALLAEEGAERAVVLRGGEPVGVVTAGDVFDAFAADGDLSRPVSDVMGEAPPVLAPGEDAEAAAAAIADGSAVVAVVDGTDVVGTVDARDLVAAARSLRPGTATDDEPLAGPSARERDMSERDVGYAEQSICESCGALSRDLAGVNGQLLCADCREV